MNKKSFENLTIVSVTGAADYIQGSIYAIQRSCEELKGAKGLLISPKLPDGIILPDNIEHKIVTPFSYLEYNIFILYQLDYFIQTDYCLIVQNDGWVLNGNNWRDEFWDYDYIGSPIPTYYKFEGNNLHGFSTEIYLNNLDWAKDPQYIQPQNGGFSLRSKKLLGLPRKLGINYQMSIPKPVDSNKELSKIEWPSNLHNEDIFITVSHRYKLMENGIKFAPSELAYYFSVESISLHNIHKIPLNQVLGCHFFGNVKLVEYNKVEMKSVKNITNMSGQEVNNLIRNSADVILFTQRNYDVHIIFPKG